MSRSESRFATLPLAENDVVEAYTPLVKRIAYHLASRLPASIQIDDLIQAGLIGLLEASRHYETDHNASFETYAGIRIRGSMLDEIRKNDWAPRSVHKKARMLSEAMRSVEEEHGRDARAQEVAEKLGLSIDEYYELLQDSCSHRVLSLEEAVVGDESLGDTIADHSANILDGIQEEDISRVLADAVSSLPERERIVMSLYYEQEMNLREIGEVIGLSESRICQIHNQAVIRLQARMVHLKNIL